ncbi:hypothetical protein [Paenibacillus humicola]|uniref:hypothetical protein n=1 Tax=Paenibacillus humicola TaxID=3110540 RepID=UPI00237A1E0E|nr:hypothetical protein [Paenibacillus humicola]
MNRTAAVLKMHTRGSAAWFYVPWLITLLSFAINLIVSIFVRQDGGIYTGGMGSMFIYLFVFGIVVVKDTFPFALGLSLRRTDYYSGTVGMFAGFSLVSAILLELLSMVESGTSGWGVQLHFYHLPYLSDGGPLTELLFFLITMLFMQLSGFFIACMQRRFGIIGLLAFFFVAAVLIGISTLLVTHYGWWGSVFEWFSKQTALDLALWQLPFIAVFLLTSFRMLRRATI